MHRSFQQFIKCTKWYVINTHIFLSITHQGGPKFEKSQNTKRQHTSKIDKLKTYWYRVPFGEKPGWKFKYGCTCGSGFHEEKTCKYNKEGHKDEANYAKRMGGSTKSFKRVNFWNSGRYSISMSNEVNETYNTTIIPGKKSQN